jgi:radical SAM superfamily enzyme YgiQ (UPF0313 family)
VKVVKVSVVKIQLISPAVEENAPVPNLALPILANLTPPDVTVSYTDDLITPIDLNKGLKEVDLVGITVLTKTAFRAYRIADAYRQRGIPVVLGGIHPTALPDEAKEHADAVVIGEAEEIWPSLIEDARRNDLKPFYRQENLIDPLRIPKPRREILPRKGYFPLDVIQVSRGCPYRCEFCSVRKFFGDTYRFRSVADVIEEVKTLSRRLIMFNDDNLTGNPSYFREFFTSMIPLRKKWIGQASLHGLRDQQNIELLAKSGCIGLLIGFESLSKLNLMLSGKPQNDPKQYREIIHALHRHGITVWASFIFGFDEDAPTIFEETVRFCIETKLIAVVFALLTPYPETAFYQRVKSEGRLYQDRWWLLENPNEVAPYFFPKKMDVETLREGWKKAWQDFYSISSIAKRFQWNYTPTLINRLAYFPFQLMQRRFARKKVVEGSRKYRIRSF